MLRIYLRERKSCLKEIDYRFKILKKRNWLKEDFVRRAICKIDGNSLDGNIINAPLIEDISMDDLSTGCKAVILLYKFPELNIFATRCGDNCVPFIMELARDNTHDVKITLFHIMRFPDDGWEGRMMDTAVTVHSFREFLENFSLIVRTPASCFKRVAKNDCKD